MPTGRRDADRGTGECVKKQNAGDQKAMMTRYFILFYTPTGVRKNIIDGPCGQVDTKDTHLLGPTDQQISKIHT